MMCQSLWQTPAAFTRTRVSRPAALAAGRRRPRAACWLCRGSRLSSFLSLGKLHQLERRAAEVTVGRTERLDDLEVVVVLADHELHRLAGRRHRDGEVARLALKFRRLERAVADDGRRAQPVQV